MAPPETRKRKSEEASEATSQMKRLRSRPAQAPAASSSTISSIRKPRPRSAAASSTSSTPRSMLSRRSPLAMSSVADEAGAEMSADSVSEMPSSDEDEGDGEDAETTPVGAGSISKSLSLRSSKAKVTDLWRSGARAPTRPQLMPSYQSSGKKVRPFLSLPRELRDQIYRELYVHTAPIAIRQPKFHLPALAHPSKPLALTHTNKQIRAEAMAIYSAENSFVLDLNILTAIDFLAAIPAPMAGNFSAITLGKSIMSGYVRYELGMFDSSRLRSDLVKRLVYEFNLKSISIEVPDEHNPNAQNGANGGPGANGGVPGGAGNGGAANAWFTLSTFHPRHDYSWSLMRELVDVLLESGFSTLRLLYATPLHHDIQNDPKTLLNLYAISRILYLDDEFEVETQVKRIEMARQAGRRDEFEDKKAVERYVRARRQMRKFEVGKGKVRGSEGSVVLIRRKGGLLEKGEGKLWDVEELMKLPGAQEGVNMEL